VVVTNKENQGLDSDESISVWFLGSKPWQVDKANYLSNEGYATLTAQYKTVDFDFWTDVTLGHNRRLQAL